MLRPTSRRYRRSIGLLLLLGILSVMLGGFGGSGEVSATTPPPPPREPDSVGPVSGVTASTSGQAPGAVRLTWTPAQNAQVHFVMYTRAAEAEAGNYTNARVVPFSGSEGVITGLRPGTRYQFIPRSGAWGRLWPAAPERVLAQSA